MPPWSGGHAAFGAAIREIRQERGLPRRRLALDAALDRSYFNEPDEKFAFSLATFDRHALASAPGDPRAGGEPEA